jgi:hypothetical protein
MTAEAENQTDIPSSSAMASKKIGFRLAEDIFRIAYISEARANVNFRTTVYAQLPTWEWRSDLEGSALTKNVSGAALIVFPGNTCMNLFSTRINPPSPLEQSRGHKASVSGKAGALTFPSCLA